MTETIPSPAAPPPPIYATVQNFCTMTGISRSTLYEALRDGKVMARKIGTRTLISVKSGLAWIEQQPAYRPEHLN